MPPYYGREQAIGQALQGLFGGIGRGVQWRREGEDRQIAADERVRLQQRQDAADAERAKELRVARALQRVQLADQGIMEGDAPETPTFQIGAVGGPAATPGDYLDAGRYEQLGDGFYRDATKTPEARARAASTAAADAKRVAIGQALQQPDPSKAMQVLLQAGFNPGEAKSAIEGARAPEAKAPVMGSPEWAAARRTELGIVDEFDRRKEGRAAARDASKPTEQKVPSESERRASGLLSVAERENGVMKELGTPGFLSRVAQDVPFGAGRFAMTDKGRQYEASAQAFARSYMYTVSGASAPEEEVKGLALQILPQPLDDEATIKAKAERRAQMLEAMRMIGGRAAQPATAPYSPNNPFR